jgi:hypothetical protein
MLNDIRRGRFHDSFRTASIEKVRLSFSESNNFPLHTYYDCLIQNYGDILVVHSLRHRLQPEHQDHRAHPVPLRRSAIHEAARLRGTVRTAASNLLPGIQCSTQHAWQIVHDKQFMANSHDVMILFYVHD